MCFGEYCSAKCEPTDGGFSGKVTGEKWHEGEPWCYIARGRSPGPPILCNWGGMSVGCGDYHDAKCADKDWNEDMGGCGVSKQVNMCHRGKCSTRCEPTDGGFSGKVTGEAWREGDPWCYIMPAEALGTPIPLICADDSGCDDDFDVKCMDKDWDGDSGGCGVSKGE